MFRIFPYSTVLVLFEQTNVKSTTELCIWTTFQLLKNLHHFSSVILPEGGFLILHIVVITSMFSLVII